MLSLHKCPPLPAIVKRTLYLFSIICFFSPSLYVSSQQLPTYITNRVTIQSGDTTIILHLLPRDKRIKPKTDKYYFWYKAQSVRYTHGGYDGQLLDGEYTEIYPDKNIKVKGQFKKGLKNSTWISWNPKGEYIDIVNWKNGYKEGDFKEYDTTGQLLRSGTYLDDQLNGKLTEYGQDGKNITKRYNNGVQLHKKEKKPVSDSLIAKPGQ